MANYVEQSTKWIGDGSEGTLDVKSSGVGSSEITLASATQGTPFNARFDCDTPVNDILYYEVKVTGMNNGTSLAVGFVTADGFQPGWKTRGCLYNGNIWLCWADNWIWQVYEEGRCSRCLSPKISQQWY